MLQAIRRVRAEIRTSIIPQVKHQLLLRTAKHINIHRIDPSNQGDMYASPVRYFRFLSDFASTDILNYTSSSGLESKIIVVGGGGLLGTEFFDPHIKNIVKAKPKLLVCWGAGENAHNSCQTSMPPELRYFDLVGIRDFGFSYDWVPCASCMDPIFDRRVEIKHEVVIYDHPKFSPIEINGLPRLPNLDTPFADIIAFLGSAETVLTSSYHGAYWSTLLGRRVIIVNPFSSKFFAMKHKHPIATAEEWQLKRQETQIYLEALEECRQANIGFSKKVEDRLSHANLS